MTTRLIAALLLAALVNLPAQAKLKVFACEPEWQALVQALGGEHVKARSATTAFQDPHFIEARPSLIARTRNADLVVCTGAGLEVGWMPLLIQQAGNSKIKPDSLGYMEAAMVVERLEIPEVVDRSLGDVHGDGNPHVALDPRRLLTIADEVHLRLVAADPANRKAYKALLADFQTRMKDAIPRWEQQAQALRGKRAVVYHKNWSYLFDWLGIEVVNTLEPKPGLPPTPGHLSSLLASVDETNTDFIVQTVYQSKKAGKWLSERTGVPVVVLPHTIGAEKQADDLFSLFDRIITLLAESGSTE